MKPGAFDLQGDNEIYRGDTFTMTVTVLSGGVGMNLTGYTVEAKIRQTELSPTVLATFTCTLANQTTNPGQVDLTLSATDTAAMTPTTGAIWDMQVTDGSGKVTTYLKGKVDVEADVTYP